RERMKLAIGAALFVLAIYLITASGHLAGQDQEYFYRMARSISRHGSFAIEPLSQLERELAGTRGREGRFYAQYAPGFPVLIAPFVFLGNITDRIEDLAPA